MDHEIRYKLTDGQGRSQYGDCSWGEGVQHDAPGEDWLCTSGWIHVYTHPLLAVLLNPVGARYDPESMRLWRCEVWGRSKTDYGLKEGWQHVKTVDELPVPVVTVEQAVRFAILVTLEVYDEATYVSWARGWLSGADRSKAAAAEAEAAAAVAAEAAAAGAAAEAAWAAERHPLDLIALAEKAMEGD